MSSNQQANVPALIPCLHRLLSGSGLSGGAGLGIPPPSQSCRDHLLSHSWSASLQQQQQQHITWKSNIRKVFNVFIAVFSWHLPAGKEEACQHWVINQLWGTPASALKTTSNPCSSPGSIFSLWLQILGATQADTVFAWPLITGGPWI